MKIGQYRQRITIQKSQMVQDETGNQKLTWQDYCTCWAYANHLSGKEYWEAAQVNKQSQIYFLVRYCKKLEGLDTTKYRVFFQGQIFNITMVDNIQYRNKTLKLVTELVKR